MPKVVQTGFCHSPPKIIIKAVFNFCMPCTVYRLSSPELKPFANFCAYLLFLIISFCVEVMSFCIVVNQGFTYMPPLFLFSPPQDIINFGLGRSSFSFIFGFPFPWCLVQSRHSNNTHTLYVELISPPTMYTSLNLSVKRSCLFKYSFMLQKKTSFQAKC